MLSVNQLDYLNYKNALKGNYRKGVHAFRTILANPTQAADFAANLGGVSLVLGWPIGQDDRNSQELLALLLESEVLDRATLTWMSQWYPDYAADWDALASDPVRAAKMVGDAQFWRAVSHSPVATGKVIATLVGLSCAEYADINAMAASETAMETVAASQTAMEAVVASETAMEAVAASHTAMEAVAASQTAMEAVVASETAMEAVAASHTAMEAVAASKTARAVIEASSAAITALANSPLVVGVSGSAKGLHESAVLYNGNAWCVSVSVNSSLYSETRVYTVDNPATYTTYKSATISKFTSKILFTSTGSTNENKGGSAKIIKC